MNGQGGTDSGWASGSSLPDTAFSSVSGGLQLSGKGKRENTGNGKSKLGLDALAARKRRERDLKS